MHCQWSPLPVVDRYFLQRLRVRVPLVLTLHDSNPYNGAEASCLMRLGHDALGRAADAVIVHTAQAERRLAAAGLPRERLHRLPHGLLHAAGVRAAGDLDRPRREPGRLVLLQFGKIKPYKGVDLLLEALAALVPQERARLRVQVVGQPYLDTAPLEAYARAHDLQDTVEFRFGFVDEAEIDRLFAGADAVVFPYREIDASGVAMIAVAHGLPVLASSVGAFGELFEDGREARLVPPGDARALAGVLREWARSPEVLPRLAEAMRARRALVPDWTEIGRRTIQVYAAARAVWLAGGRAAPRQGRARLSQEGVS
jgi:glycosyltransferase involved in cell wall biosynthesis